MKYYQPNKKNNIIFVIGCPRSGTTAIAKLLNEAHNAMIFNEQKPKLCIEARMHYERRLENPIKFLKDSRTKKINEVLSKNLIYGDKNPNYLPFFSELESIWSPQYLFIVRDGRDVVRSLMDWHHYSDGNIFGMQEDDPDSNVSSPQQDWWDYSRLRPKEGSLNRRRWNSMPRFEKLAWYWTQFNKLILDCSEKLPKSRYNILKIDKTKSNELEYIFNFLGLQYNDINKITDIFHSGINSVEDRYGVENRFPRWEKWDSNLINLFYKYGNEVMSKFGYVN